MNSKDTADLRLDQVELLDGIRELLCDIAERPQPEPLLEDISNMILRIDRTVEALR